ncbi:uncharacterized protein ACA1_138410 [Acanthamoeba castellanii str. Neff]|uniref:Methyltransferase domain-containing protein n=1 Tax=Acanthamoeba castellanii (strain ATCC 30010 / Neff) TaxID=1257118 RepID=L8GYQ7_ACACF|nr:uncharacterized protein ACA1_138410 [Acanthamoeba castellanii str. Neff]ELR18419.1 hypothetical protein ACA1_138410 [Acanthamoeba castellanii str. Neff]
MRSVTRPSLPVWKVGLLVVALIVVYSYMSLYGEVGALSRSLRRVEHLLQTQEEEDDEAQALGPTQEEEHDHQKEDEEELIERRLAEALREIDRLDPSKKRRKEEFQRIWDNFAWGPADRSGPGSTAEASARARVAVETVVRQFGIRTMLDSPCGSFSWMPLINFEALNVTYVGVDIVPGNIEKAKAAWPTKQPHVFQFYCADVVDGFEFVDKLVLQAQQDYPTNTHDWSQGWDLIFSREFLQHIPHEAVKRVLHNFNKTGSKYLLLTHDPSRAINKDIEFGGYAPINMRVPPFNLGPPLADFPDAGHERLLLYKLPLVGFED